MPLDPYKELGLPRDATTSDVRAAYRKKAKTVHPDQGGDREAFERAQTSMLVLTDPKRREKYDNTGTVDPTEPDNVRSTALQIIESLLAEMINRFAASGFNSAADPRKGDMVVALRINLQDKIAIARQNIASGQDHAKFLRDMRKRFCTKKPAESGDEDPIGRGFDRQVERAESQISEIEKSIVALKMALDIVGSYTFRQDSDDFGADFPGGLYIGMRGIHS